MGSVNDHIAAAIATPGDINDKLIAFFSAVHYTNGDPNGLVDAPYGSIAMNFSGVGAPFFVKDTPLGTLTGWEPVTGGSTSSGSYPPFHMTLDFTVPADKQVVIGTMIYGDAGTKIIGGAGGILIGRAT